LLQRARGFSAPFCFAAFAAASCTATFAPLEDDMKQASGPRPGILGLAAWTWRGTLGVLLGLLPLCAVVTAALFGLNYVFPILEQEAAVLRPASTSIFVLMVVPDAWFFGLEKLALGLVAAPMALAAQRYVLTPDGTRLPPGPLLRFWLWAAAVLIFGLGALYLAGLAVTPELQLVSLVLKGFAFLVPFLLLLVFPAVAAEAPAANIVARLDTALGHWEGNVLRFLGVLLLTVGPALLLQRLPEAILQRGDSAGAVQAFDASLLGSAVHSALTVVLIVAGAVALAWCYHFARLPRPVKPQDAALGQTKTNK
jgi:hypothetical protein